MIPHEHDGADRDGANEESDGQRSEWIVVGSHKQYFNQCGISVAGRICSGGWLWRLRFCDRHR